MGWLVFVWQSQTDEFDDTVAAEVEFDFLATAVCYAAIWVLRCKRPRVFWLRR